MTTMLKRAVAAFALAGIVAGTLAPRMASAHAELTEDEKAGTPRTHWRNVHPPQRPENFRVQRLASSPHNAIVVSWDESHFHPHSPEALPNSGIAQVSTEKPYAVIA